MTSHHHHDHEHPHHEHHHHDHEHHHHGHEDHHHEQTSDGQMTFPQKMDRLLDHWIHHNDDHAENYRTWADRARQNGMDKMADMLDEAARQTEEITKIFQAAKKEG